MNTDQIASIIRTGLKLFSAYLVTKGYGQLGHLINSPDILALVLLVGSMLWSHVAHITYGSKPPAVRQPNGGAGTVSAIVTALVLALAFTAPCHAQTVVITNAPGNVETAPLSFFGTTESFLTSFNTNSTTFQTENVAIWSGVDNGPDTLSALLGITVPVKTNYFAEAVMENADVDGTVLSLAGGAGYRVVKFDVEMMFGLDVGYRFDDKAAFVTGFGDIRKALSDNTYTGVRLYYEQEFSHGTGAHPPGVLAIVGFKF